MWKGRFKQDTSDLLKSYGESITTDWRLYAHDIRGSIAHARALVAAGILKPREFQKIEQGLTAIRDEIAAGKFEFDTALEDVHMNIEAELTRRIGEPGAKLHTARSRNDQVAVDIRMWMRDEIVRVQSLLRGMQSALVDLASRHQEAVMPGYTHLQRAQPVLFAHHLLAYVEMFDRDHGRLGDCAKRLNVMPLGSGAIAASTIVLDREAVANELGFDSVSQNSMDAVSDRDFACEALSALALIGIHLSRISEDVIIWASAEFGFIELSDRHTTGSSLMPQKKNPDIAELTRGKSGRLLGNLVSLLTLLKGLPLTYNRDMQEDKEPIFDSFDTVTAALEIFAEMMRDAVFCEERARAAALDPMLLATDLADRLVLAGVPFRKSHELVGGLVAKAATRGVALDLLPAEDFLDASPSLTPEVVASVFDLSSGLEARRAPGSPAPRNVNARLAHWQKILAS